MTLTFYCLSGSPFSWKVWLTLEHVGAGYDLRVLSADAGEHKAPAYLALNPRGKVPTLVADGFALRESAAIVEYLADRFPAAGVWPDGLRERAEARRMAAEVDAYLYPPVRRLVVEIVMRKDGNPDRAAITDAMAALSTELSRIEAHLSGMVSATFLAGERASAADFALYPLTAILTRVGKRAPHLALAALLGPQTRAWCSRIEALPYFARTVPPHWQTT